MLVFGDCVVFTLLFFFRPSRMRVVLVSRFMLYARDARKHLLIAEHTHTRRPLNRFRCERCTTIGAERVQCAVKRSAHDEGRRMYATGVACSMLVL